MLQKVLAACIILVTASVAAASAQARGVVSVVYAGSLVTPMEGPVKAALATAGIEFQGEGGGSKMLANLIASGAKNPDVFVSVDPKVVAGLGSKVASAQAFASTSLGVGWSNGSKFAALFADVASGKRSLLAALATPGLTIGRTVPKLDPKGQYTVEAMTVLAGADGERRILGEDENPAQTFPEQDLLVRIETGEADVGFFYRTEAIARGLNFAPLPGAAAMSERITYVIAIMKSAPHPTQAKAFQDFILTGAGKRILRTAGLEYFERPRTLAQ
ncbi:MAG: extracellular solute-binding protein [Candidatus Tumulicola sp.]